MPITIRHTPVGALGRLAVQAGQARGAQVRAAQDIQFTSMALAAQDRAAQIGLAARDRSFALQRAASSQVARQRKVAPDALAQRQKLRRVVSEAKAADIYEPAQIKQAQIFANLGDMNAVRSILGKISQPSARRRELGEQLKAVTKIGGEATSALQKQVNAIGDKLGERFNPFAQRFLRENPQFADEEAKALFAQQDRITEQINEINTEMTRVGKGLQLGISIPEQRAFEVREEVQADRQEAAEFKRMMDRAKGVGKLTEQEELAIDVMRDQERDKRRAIGKEIARQSKELFPLEDESPKDTILRLQPQQLEIRVLELEVIASHAREKQQVAEFLGKAGGVKRAPTTGGQYVSGQIITSPTGKRYRFTRYIDGKPMVEEIE